MKQQEGKYKKIVGNILFYAVLLLLIFSVDARSWVLQQVIKVGLFNAEIKNTIVVNNATATDFTFYTPEGTLVSTAQLKCKVVFINFWATWCPPCRAEMPSLHALYNRLKSDDRFVFLFVNEDDDSTKAAAFLQKESFSFPMVRLAGAVPKAIYSGTLPTTVVLDKEGRLVFKKDGIANYNTHKFVKQLQSLL